MEGGNSSMRGRFQVGCDWASGGQVLLSGQAGCEAWKGLGCRNDKSGGIASARGWVVLVGAGDTGCVGVQSGLIAVLWWGACG